MVVIPFITDPNYGNSFNGNCNDGHLLLTKDSWVDKWTRLFDYLQFQATVVDMSLV